VTTWRTLTKAEFDVWHESYKRDNGFPLRGRNALTGELAPEGVGETRELVEPVEVTKGTDVRFLDFVDAKIGKEAAQPVFKEDGAIDKLATLAEDAKLEQAKLDEAANLAGGRQHPTRHVSV
jgi:hypothetical protein